MSSGFYKKEGNNEILLYAENSVHGPGFDIYVSQKDNYSYPIYDWYWFASEDEAYAFFCMQKPSSPKSPEEQLKEAQESWTANSLYELPQQPPPIFLNTEE